MQNLRFRVHGQTGLAWRGQRQVAVFVEDDQPVARADKRGTRHAPIPPGHLSGVNVNGGERCGTEVAIGRVDTISQPHGVAEMDADAFVRPDFVR